MFTDMEFHRYEHMRKFFVAAAGISTANVWSGTTTAQKIRKMAMKMAVKDTTPRRVAHVVSSTKISKGFGNVKKTSGSCDRSPKGMQVLPIGERKRLHRQTTAKSETHTT